MSIINPILADYDILNFCNLYKNNPICSCVNPPNTISIISTNFFEPYYCWYTPCLIGNYYKTNYIKKEQLKCNTTNCKISIGEIVIDAHNTITISNNCASGLSNNVYIQENDYTFQPLSIPLINLKYILLIFGIFLCII
jgi:hypothetical protein